MRRFEAFLREQAADFIKAEVHRANDPCPDDEPPSPTPENIRETPLYFIVRRLLKHAAEDFSRPAFARMVANARRDVRRYWEFARCHWSQSLGIDISEIDIPQDASELEQKFWSRVDAAIGEALRERGSRPAKKRDKRAG